MAKGSSSGIIMSDSKAQLLPSPGESFVTLVLQHMHVGAATLRHRMFHPQSQMPACPVIQTK